MLCTLQGKILHLGLEEPAVFLQFELQLRTLLLFPRH